MNQEFTYYKDDVCLKNGFAKAIDFIKKEKIVLDTKYLPLIEAAESGDASACHDLHCAFKWGHYSLPLNYQLSLYFLSLSRKNEADDLFLNFCSTCCLGDTHYKFGNIEEAQKSYIAAAKMMVDLPIEQWDFEMLQMLRELIAQSDK